MQTIKVWLCWEKCFTSEKCSKLYFLGDFLNQPSRITKQKLLLLTHLVFFIGSYTCNNNQPWAVNSTFAYGFVAGRITGQSEYDWCCACYELTFTSGPVNGKKMVVQVTNTGGDLGVSLRKETQNVMEFVSF